MTEAARWGPKAFGCSTEKLVPLMDFKSSMSTEDKSSSKKPEVVNITTRYIKGTGIDPWGQVEEWRSLIGKTNVLYIGGKQFGANGFALTSIKAEDFYLSNAGDFIGVKVSITLEERIPAVIKKTSTTPVTTTTTTVNLEDIPYDELTPEQKQALGARQRRAGEQVPNPADAIYAAQKEMEQFTNANSIKKAIDKYQSGDSLVGYGTTAFPTVSNNGSRPNSNNGGNNSLIEKS